MEPALAAWTHTHAPPFRHFTLHAGWLTTTAQELVRAKRGYWFMRWTVPAEVPSGLAFGSKISITPGLALHSIGNRPGWPRVP